jgi:hypothetical protein
LVAYTGSNYNNTLYSLLEVLQSFFNNSAIWQPAEDIE